MTEERIASLTVDGSQAKAELDAVAAGFDKVGASADGSGKALERTTTRIRESDAATKRLLQSIPGTAAAMAEMERRAATLDRELAAGRITADDHAKALDRLKQRYVEGAGASSRMNAEIERSMQAWAAWSRNFTAADAAMARSNIVNFTQQVMATGNATQALSVQARRGDGRRHGCAEGPLRRQRQGDALRLGRSRA